MTMLSRGVKIILYALKIIVLHITKRQVKLKTEFNDTKQGGS